MSSFSAPSVLKDTQDNQKAGYANKGHKDFKKKKAEKKPGCQCSNPTPCGLDAETNALGKWADVEIDDPVLYEPKIVCLHYKSSLIFSLLPDCCYENKGVNNERLYPIESKE